MFAMINAVDKRYGGWNSNKGDRNYLEIMGIPIFSTRALAQSGLLTLKDKRRERTGWNDPNHLYPDIFYKTWLLQPMKGCPYLEHLRHTFDDDDKMTFDACQASLLRKLARGKDEESSMSAKLLGLTVQQTSAMPYPRDNTNDQYHGNSAMYDGEYASQTSAQRDNTNSSQFESNSATYEGGFQGQTATTSSQRQIETMSRCYICNQLGHFQSACPHAGFTPGQISQQQKGRGFQGQQLGRGNFGQPQGRGNQGGFQ